MCKMSPFIIFLMQNMNKFNIFDNQRVIHAILEH